MKVMNGSCASEQPALPVAQTVFDGLRMESRIVQSGFPVFPNPLHVPQGCFQPRKNALHEIQGFVTTFFCSLHEMQKQPAFCAAGLHVVQAPFPLSQNTTKYT
jgi:hypothetical protein